MQKRLLVTRDRIILHLMRYTSREIQDYTAPVELTQEGIADAVGIGRNNLPREIKKLIEEKSIASKKVRVSGFRNRKSVYFLTPKGIRRGNRLLDWGKILNINVIDFEGNVERMRLEDAVQRYGIDPITAIIHLNTDLSLRLDEIMEEEKCGTHVIDFNFRLKGGFLRMAEVDSINSWRRSKDRILLVKGEKCVGKTTVVHQWIKEHGKGDNILWISLNPFLSRVEVALSIAEYLSKMGRYRLKKYIKFSLNDVENGIMWENVLLTLRKDVKNDIFIFDNVDSADHDVKDFLRDILDMVTRIGEFRVILIGENPEEVLPESKAILSRTLEIGPMGKDDAIRFLVSLGWNEESAAQAYEKFGGSPCLLELISTCKGDVVKCEDPVEELIRNLTEEERRAIELASAYSLHFDVDFLLENDVEEWVINSLKNKRIFREVGDVLYLHPLVKERIVRRIPLEKRKENHILVAQYFEERGEDIKAVDHYMRGGDYIRAARLLYSSFRRYVPVKGMECLEEIVSTMLEEAENLPPQDSARLYIMLGETYESRGMWDRAVKEYERARKIVIGVDYDIYAYATLRMAEIAAKMGNDKEAVSVIKGVLKFEGKIKDMNILGHLYYILGVVLVRRGAYDEGEKALHKVVRIGRRTSDYELLGYGHNGLGIYHRRMRRCEDAIHHFKESKRYFEIIKNMRGVAKALTNIGTIYYDMHDKRAEKYFKEALKIARRIGDLWQIGLIKMHMGSYYLMVDNYDMASRNLTEAKRIMESLDAKDVLPFVYTAYGALLIETGDADEGEKYLRKAVGMAGKDGDKKNIVGFIVELLSEKGFDTSHYEELLGE